MLTGSGLCFIFGVFAFSPTGDVLLSLMAVGAGLFLTGTILVSVSKFP